MYSSKTTTASDIQDPKRTGMLYFWNQFSCIPMRFSETNEAGEIHAFHQNSVGFILGIRVSTIEKLMFNVLEGHLQACFGS